MTRKPVLILALLSLVLILTQPLPAQAGPTIFASPVHAGCYLAKPDRCKIHVDPFTINITLGKKLAKFQLVAIQAGGGPQTVIYDFRPDQSNPPPSSGSTYTPSKVAKDYAATCGTSYEISLQGMDSGDTNMLNLGLTAQFTCPKGTYTQRLPLIRKN